MDCDDAFRDPKLALCSEILMNIFSYIGVVDVLKLNRVCFTWFEVANLHLHLVFNAKDHRYNWLRDHIHFGMSPYSLKNMQKMYTTILNEDTRQQIFLYEKLETDQGTQNVQYVEKVEQIIFKNYKFLRKQLYVPVTKTYLLDYTFWKIEQFADKKLCCNCKEVLKTEHFYDSVCFFHPGEKYIEDRYNSVCWTCCGPSGPTRGCEATDHHVEATIWNPDFVPKRLNPLDFSVTIKVINNNSKVSYLTAKMRQKWSDINDQILQIVCNGSTSTARNTDFYIIQRKKMIENLHPIRIEPSNLIFELFFTSNLETKAINSYSKLQLQVFAVRPREDEITLQIKLFPPFQNSTTRSIKYGMETNELYKELAIDINMDDDELRLEFGMGNELPKSRDSILKAALRNKRDFSPFRQPLELFLFQQH